MVGHIFIKAKDDCSERDTEFINANWCECCHLLGQLELSKKLLIEYMDNIKPEWEVTENG